MKLYKTIYFDDETETAKAQWVGTQADAGRLRQSLKADGMREIVTNETDVPTDKAGLLAFLNAGS